MGNRIVLMEQMKDLIVTLKNVNIKMVCAQITAPKHLRYMLSTTVNIYFANYFVNLLGSTLLMS